MSLTTNLAGLQIVLVEPSSMQAHLVRRMLNNLGVLDIHSCESGEAALTILRKGGLDAAVVISSLYLPDMAGTDLVAAMREDTWLETTPFILISSETRPQRLEGVRQSGACSIVGKPFTEQQLMRAVYSAADYLNPPSDLSTAEVEDLKILLVDDSLASRRHIRRLLEELHIEKVIEAHNGKEAVELLHEMSVDLVITDYNMPEMDGKELVEYIRTQSWQAEVPVLMVTSEQNQGRLAAVERAGVSAVCDKPFEAETIRKLISEALAR